jgi:hypothetical protein
MTFLPIVERELQVSARRRVTYWLRSGAALLATALAVWIFETSRAVTGAAAGGQLFGMLSTFAWTACLVTGIFLTADCLSEEKRSGTLGLLFLTDLRPADIILGKLTANSLNGFYGLLAIFPVLAMPLILGGVNWWDFARVSVALTATLFFSLSLGMLCSACFRAERPSMATTAGALVAWSLPTIAVPGLRMVSPLGLHLLAIDQGGTTSATQYGVSLAVVLGLACAFLWGAARILPRTWQDEPVGTRVSTWRKFTFTQSPRRLPASSPAVERAPKLEANPAEWLFSRHSSSSLIWLVTGLGAIVLLLTWFNPTPAWWPQLFLVCMIHAALKLCMAWEASRLLEDHHRAGGLELVLVSGMSVVDILTGCVGTLRQLFKRAIAVVIFLDAITALVMVARSFGGAAPWGGNDVLSGTFVTGLILLGMLLQDLWAIGWLGMWLGLRHHRPWRAALECALRLFILPWVIPMSALVLSGGSNGGLTGLPVAMFLGWICCSFTVAYMLGSGAKRKLHEEFRQKVAST